MLLVRFVVAFACIAAATADWQWETTVDVFEGVLEGFFGGSAPSLKSCADDTVNTYNQIQSAVQQINVDTSGISEIEDAIMGLGQALTAIKQLSKDCQSAESQIETLVSTIENAFVNPASFAFHCGKDLIVNGFDIYGEISSAVNDWESQSYRDFGNQIGMALEKMLIGSGFSATADANSSNMLGDSMTSVVSDPYTPTVDNSHQCTSCQEEIEKLDIKWGQGSVDDAVADLKAKCKAKEGHHYIKREICDKVADVFGKIPPQIFQGMTDLEWPINLGTCATLKQCKLECCGEKSAPEQVHLSLAAEDRSIMGVTWVTLNKNETVVQYGQSASNLDIVDSGTTTTYKQAGWIGTIHRAMMKNLKPATKYFYRVGSPSADSWSEVFSFNTFDPAQKTQTFAVLADMDFDSLGANNTIARLTEMVDAGTLDAVVHSGDISYADGYMPHWDVYFNKIQTIAARVPYMVTAGNHEFWYNFAAYKARFYMPSVDGLPGKGSGDNMYYGWKYGPVSFAAMNSETAVDTQDFKDSEIKFWEKEFSEIDRTVTPFVIAHFHRPLYCTSDSACSRGDGKINKLTKKGEDMMFNAQVDMCISGHVHDYERTYPMYKEELVTKDFTASTYQAPLYIVQGASGNREGNKGEASFPDPEPEWSAGHSSDVGYGLMVVSNIDGERPTLNWSFMRSSDNEELDKFTLQK